MPDSMMDIAEKVIGHRFSDPELLHRALTHASLTDDRLQSNERLEFLGDAVLGMVVCQYLHDRFPDLLEGEMTKVEVDGGCQQTGLCRDGSGHGPRRTADAGQGNGHRGTSADLRRGSRLEAILGAVFLDSGLEAVTKLILRDIEDRIHLMRPRPVIIPTSSLFFSRSPSRYSARHQPIHCWTSKDRIMPSASEIAVSIGTRRFESCWVRARKAPNRRRR